MPETTYTIIKKTIAPESLKQGTVPEAAVVDRTSATENVHPSLRNPPLQNSRTAAETLLKLNREISSIQDTIASVRDKTLVVETDLTNLDAISILVHVEQLVVDFAEKYSAALDKLYVNADLEREVLEKLTGS